jgi:hypothetical protein
MNKFLTFAAAVVSAANASRIHARQDVTSTVTETVINEQDVATSMNTAEDWDFTNTFEEWDFESFDSESIVDITPFDSVVETFEFTYDVPEDVTEGSSDDETADDIDEDVEYYNDDEFTLNNVPTDCEEALLWY